MYRLYLFDETFYIVFILPSALGRNVHNYSSATSDINRRAEAALLPKQPVGVWTPWRAGMTICSPEKKKPSRSGGGGPDEEPSYVLNQVLQVIVNVLVFQALLGREGPGKDSRAAAFKVETAINCVCVCVCVISGNNRWS